MHADPSLNYDVSTREARDRLVSPPVLGSARAKTVPSQPRGPEEAAARLARFRPSRESIAVLRTLLEARADANIIPGPGDISPLRTVICFAPSCAVRDMRQLLLDHGAVNDKETQERWRRREWIDKHEAAWLTNFHKDDREG